MTDIETLRQQIEGESRYAMAPLWFAGLVDDSGGWLHHPCLAQNDAHVM